MNLGGQHRDGERLGVAFAHHLQDVGDARIGGSPRRLILLTGDQQDRLFERVLREPLAPRIEAARPFEQPVENPA